MHSDPCTETKLRRPLSPRSSSWQEPIHHVAHPRGAVALQVHAEDAEMGELGNDLERKGRALVVLGNDWQESLVDEARHRPPDASLLLGQAVVDTIEGNELVHSEPAL